MNRPVVAFVVNGGPDSAMGERANSFADRLQELFDVRLVFRRGGKIRAVGRMLRELAAIRPEVSYVFDLAAAGVLAAGAYKIATGTPMIVDTGDAIVELGRVLGRGSFGMTATRSLEAFALRAAAHVVVRGTVHKELLTRRGVRATVIPDGVTVDQFAPLEPNTVRSRVREPLTIGVVGSVVWVPAQQTCYGWELVELLRLLRERVPVRGVIVGDGSGIEVLRRRATDYGIADRIEFAGRVPYANLPQWIRQFDICLSTQTNDVIGNVRTTGKLPLYLAAGRFILASRVGEAARVLPPEMLVDFHGSIDPDYPARLAERIVELHGDGEAFGHRADSVGLAREYFDYDRLTPRVASVLCSVIATNQCSRASRS